MQKILGIDVGSYSVKIALIKLDADMCTVEHLIEEKIEYIENISESDAKYNAISKILAFIKSFLLSDSVYAGLGSHYVVPKRFEFHKITRSDRQKLIENEFESYSIYDMDDSAIEYHTIFFNKSLALVLGFLLAKKPARDLIDVLTRNELTVHTIDIEGMSFLNILPYISTSNKADRGIDLIIDIGHAKTTLVITEKNKVLFLHAIRMAGDYLSSILKDKLSLQSIDVDRLKQGQTISFSEETISGYQKILKSFFADLAFEVKRVLKAHNAKEFIGIKRILITGGLSHYSEINQIFYQQTGIPSFFLEVQHKNIDMTIYKDSNISSFHQVLALALRGTQNKTNSKMNIRHGNLALVSNYQKIFQQTSFYGRMVLIVILILTCSYFFRYFMYNQKIEQMKVNFKKEVLELLEEEPRNLRLISSQNNWDFENYALQAKKELNENLKSKSSFVENLTSKNGPTSLRILKEISMAVEKNIVFEVAEFKIKDNILYIEADTNNKDSVADILKKLESISILSKVEKKSQKNKAGTDGQMITFVVTANINQ